MKAGEREAILKELEDSFTALQEAHHQLLRALKNKSSGEAIKNLEKEAKVAEARFGTALEELDKFSFSI